LVDPRENSRAGTRMLPVAMVTALIVGMLIISGCASRNAAGPARIDRARDFVTGLNDWRADAEWPPENPRGIEKIG